MIFLSGNLHIIWKRSKFDLKTISSKIKKIECLQISNFLRFKMMKLVVFENHFGGQILNRSLVPLKKQHERNSTLYLNPNDDL